MEVLEALSLSPQSPQRAEAIASSHSRRFTTVLARLVGAHRLRYVVASTARQTGSLIILSAPEPGYRSYSDNPRHTAVTTIVTSANNSSSVHTKYVTMESCTGGTLLAKSYW